VYISPTAGSSQVLAPVERSTRPHVSAWPALDGCRRTGIISRRGASLRGRSLWAVDGHPGRAALVDCRLPRHVWR
jgi:hypothetical protein